VAALRKGGFLYPCVCTRKDLAQAASAPNDADDEPVYPGSVVRAQIKIKTRTIAWSLPASTGDSAFPMARWQSFLIESGPATLCRGQDQGKDFGDFLVWRRDDVPAYQLAVVVDDEAMKITEVVRARTC